MKKPVAKLSGQNGNMFNLLGIASKSLKSAGQHSKAKEMIDKAMSSGSYHEVLSVISEYVEVV